MVPTDEESFPGGVLRGDTTRDIARLTDPGLTAVIVAPGERPGWLDELAELVVSRKGHLSRRRSRSGRSAGSVAKSARATGSRPAPSAPTGTGGGTGTPTERK
ncbi:hypothetical protein [Streptomyces venezuelae]